MENFNSSDYLLSNLKTFHLIVKTFHLKCQLILELLEQSRKIEKELENIVPFKYPDKQKFAL